MVKRVDFLGAPGVGKSTLYNRIIEENVKNCISEKRALLYAGVNFTKKLSFPISIVLKLGLLIPGIQNVLLNSIQMRTSRTNLQQSILKHGEFFGTVEKMYSNVNSSHRYGKIQGFLSFLQKMKALEFIEYFYSDNRWILFDESLSQKVYGMYGIRSIDHEDLKYIHDYFSAMPLPDKLIYIHSDPENIVKNIRHRKSTKGFSIPGHENLNTEELRKRTECALIISDLGCSILKKKGVSVLEIRSTASIEQNLVKINEFLR